MKFITTFFISVIAFLTIWSVIPTAEEVNVYESTVRLHVIANSDTEEDQEVKLKVRDAIVENLANCGAKSKDEALSYIESNQAEIEKIAGQVLTENNFGYGAKVLIGEEKYPTRTYENFALPAGNYTSVRIVLGSGEGKNWWCVLFPPLCTSCALEYDEDSCVDVGLTKDQYKLITGTDGEYKVKFRLLEIASDAFNFNYK